MREVTCQMCGETFKAKNTMEEAEADLKKHFPDAKREDCSVLCHRCGIMALAFSGQHDKIDEIRRTELERMMKESPDEEVIIICNPKDEPSPYKDNTDGACAECGAEIYWRPYIPEKAKKICIQCGVNMAKAMHEAEGSIKH